MSGVSTLISTAAALALGIGGIGLVYAAWRTGNRLAAITGWGLSTGASCAWYLAVDLEFALVYTLALPALAVWPYIAREASRLAPKALPAAEHTPLDWRWRVAFRHAAHALVLLLVLPTLSLVSVVALSRMLALRTWVDDAGAAAISVFLLPALWAGLAHAYLATRRKAVIIGGTSITSAVFLGAALAVARPA